VTAGSPGSSGLRRLDANSVTGFISGANVTPTHSARFFYASPEPVYDAVGLLLPRDVKML